MATTEAGALNGLHPEKLEAVITALATLSILGATAGEL